MLPPTENTDMPLARWSPLAYAANFDPSGWKAAVPSPLTTTHRTTSPYAGAAAASAMPTPATATPVESSQSAPRRSDQSPNSGWITELENVDASTITAASV